MHTSAPPVDLPSDEWPAPRGVRPSRAAMGLATVAVITAVALLLTGSIAAAMAPMLVAAIGYAVWTLPLRYTVLAFLFPVAMAFEPPRSIVESYDIQASGFLWTTMLKPVNDFLNVYLNRLTGIGALAITGTEAIYLVLVTMVVVRSVRGDAIDSVGRAPGANALFALCGLSFAALLSLEAFGIVRGGDARATLFQIRHLAMLPILMVVFSHALRGVRDFAAAIVVVTAGTCVKIALGAYFLIHDAWAQGVEPEYMTGHHDTVLFVVVLFAWTAAWIHRPRLRTLVPTLLLVGWIGMGIVLNDRRVAYVSLAECFIGLYALLRGRMKRRVTRTLLASIPLLAPYLLLARTHAGGIFKPGAELVSVSDRSDPSNVWRDMENMNLIATLRANTVVGSGWGHEYIEIVRAADISRYMPQYRLTPHNSVLWLIGVGGIIGFTLLWMPLPAGVYFAARSYAHARTPLEQTAAVTALGVFVAYLNQDWGDMGTQSPLSTILVAGALALAGKLARSTGAWPAAARLVGARRGKGYVPPSERSPTPADPERASL